jgi:hypothetical protein
MVVRHHVRDHKREDYHVNDYMRGKGTRVRAFDSKYEGLRGGPSTRLTYRERQMLPESAFAEPSRRAYPVPTVAEFEALGYSRKEAQRAGARHAVDALSRVSHNGTDAEKRRVCELVARRYPQIHERGCKRHKDPVVASEMPGKPVVEEHFNTPQGAAAEAKDY